jgi:CubicO group peptidase (beta-lactamase class C family)
MLDTGKAMGLTGEGESGWSGAASTYFWVDPLENMTGVVLSQYLGSMLPLADSMRTAAYQMLE